MNCYLTALFWRVSARGGRKKAALAVAHRMLTIIWHIIGEGKSYREIGADYYERQHPDRNARRLIRRLQQLGFVVEAKRQAPSTPVGAEAAPVAESNPSPDPVPRVRHSAPKTNASTSAKPSKPTKIPEAARKKEAAVAEARNFCHHALSRTNLKERFSKEAWHFNLAGLRSNAAAFRVSVVKSRPFGAAANHRFSIYRPCARTNRSTGMQYWLLFKPKAWEQL